MDIYSGQTSGVVFRDEFLGHRNVQDVNMGQRGVIFRLCTSGNIAEKELKCNTQNLVALSFQRSSQSYRMEYCITLSETFMFE